MKKSHISAVWLLALANSAISAADTTNVNVYGTLNVSAESVRATGSSTGKEYPTHIRLSDNSSNFGIKGTEEISAHLKAAFQVELDVRPGAGTLPGLRDTMVGVQGSWGTLFFGKWSTPFRVALYFAEPQYASGTGAMAPLTRTAGNSSTDKKSFSLRKNQIIQYWSPSLHGVSARLAYSPKEPAAANSQYLVSSSLLYSEGPLNAAISYEFHRDFVAVGQSDWGLQGGAGYTFWDATSINLAWSQLTYRNPSQISETKRSLMLTFGQKLGEFALRGGVARTGNLQDSVSGEFDGTGAYQVTLVGAYKASKRLELYALFSQITNQQKAFYNFVSDGYVGPSLNDPTVPGTDPRAIGFGIRHSF